MLSSSAKLLASVNNYDGVADLTYPARASVYLTTFPFSGKDVRKWSWLFAAVAASGGGLEGEWLPEPPKRSGPTGVSVGMPFDAENDNPDVDWNGCGDVYEYDRYPALNDRRNIHRRPRDRSPYYDNNIVINGDIPRILLSRVLDGSVIPDADGVEKKDVKDVRFWVVVQNRVRVKEVKLLVAESRKAAGMLCFYEALNGNSVVFVGAAVGGGKLLKREKGAKVKVKKAESLEEARKMRDEEDGIVGVIC
jgi:hypothetical protein